MGFHEGELATQRRAGVLTDAARLAGMLDRADLVGGASRFLADRTVAALTARDDRGRLWTTALTGEPGFLSASGTHLRVDAHPTGPLAGLAAGQPVGLIAIDYPRRRRLRVNGTLVATDDRLEIDADQAFGNCPQYIPPHRFTRAAPAGGPRRSEVLSERQAALVRRSDTFFLGTTHPDRGVDASHRGGPPGFVRVAGRELWWPDYPGNNMFLSLGNLAVDDAAALLFLDFEAGTLLHLSGTATVDWPPPDSPTERRVRFTVHAVAES